MEKKQVHWSGSCRVRPFPMVDEEDKIYVWYAPEDYKDFKKERKAAAALASSIGLETMEKTDFVSCRGIEYMVDQKRLDRKIKLLSKAMVAVLRAQTRVFEQADELGEEPDLASSEVIAFNYNRYSRQAHFEASQRALQQWGASQKEEMEAQEVEELPTTRTSSRRNVLRQEEQREEEQNYTPRDTTDCGRPASFRARLRKQLSFTKRGAGEQKKGWVAAMA